MGILDYIKLAIGGVAVIVCLWYGYAWGARDVQARWDKQTTELQLAETKQRNDEQAKADKAAAATQTQLSTQQDAIKNLTQELYDANISLGTCGHQPLDALRMQQYKRNAASL